jgi:hypothetical protein
MGAEMAEYNHVMKEVMKETQAREQLQNVLKSTDTKTS